MMSSSSNNTSNTSASVDGRGGSSSRRRRRRRRRRSVQPEQRLRRYELWRSWPIGSGAYASVVPARHLLTGHHVAVKILPRMTEEVQREIEILRLLQQHPHVIRFYEAIVGDDDDEQVYIVMELAESRELHDHVVSYGKLDEGEARRVFQQTVAAVAHCHRNMVVHGDIKLDNILLDSHKNVRIVDFGFSRLFRHNQLVTARCGSLRYAAPELFEGTRHVGPEVDVWSCGVVLFAMLCGRLPFDGPDDSPALIKSKTLKGNFRIPSNLSDQSRDLISSMLQLNPAKRMTIDEVREHPWLQPSIPRYLLPPMPPLDAANIRQISKVDDEAVEEVVRIGFDKNSLLQSLQNRVEDEATVVYYLILDKRFGARTRYFQTACEETWQHIRQATPLHTGTEESAACSSMVVRVPDGKYSKWALGLEFHDCPHETMRNVAEVLQGLDVLYSKHGYYKMICALSPGIPSATVRAMIQKQSSQNSRTPHQIDSILQSLLSAAPVLFEIQLYKAGERNYQLDLRRISGPQLEYLSLCSDLVSKLRIG